MTRPLWPTRLLGLALLVAIGGCGGDGASSDGSGTLALRLTDAPFPATEGCLEAAIIVIDRIHVKGDDGFVELPITNEDGGSTISLNLLELRAGISEEIAIGQLPTGAYREVRLRIAEAYMEFEDGSPTQPFKVPSGMSSGLKIKIDPPVLVAAGQTVPLLLDFDVAASFHTTGLGGTPTCDDLKAGENQVIFRPVVKALNPNEHAVITGTVYDAAVMPVADAEVTAFPAGTTVNADTEPSVSTFSSPTGLRNVPPGSYALHVTPGTYDLYVRPQGAPDRALALPGVAVAAGDLLTDQDLTLP